jgi:hypothetical protein
VRCCCLLGGHRLTACPIGTTRTMYNSNPSPYYTVPYHDPFPEEPNRVQVIPQICPDHPSRTPPWKPDTKTPRLCIKTIHPSHPLSIIQNNTSTHCAGTSSATFCATAEAFATAAEPVNPLTASTTASVALAAVCQMVSAAFWVEFPSEASPAQ